MAVARCVRLGGTYCTSHSLPRKLVLTYLDYHDCKSVVKDMFKRRFILVLDCVAIRVSLNGHGAGYSTMKIIHFMGCVRGHDPTRIWLGGYNTLKRELIKQ